MMCLELGEVLHRALALRKVFEIGERELSTVVVPPDPMRVLVSNLEAVPHHAYSFLKICGEAETDILGVTELLRGADALRLATLEEHGLKRGVEVARDCYAVHEPDLDVRVTRQKAADRGALLGQFFLEGREDGARHHALGRTIVDWSRGSDSGRRRLPYFRLSCALIKLRLDVRRVGDRTAGNCSTERAIAALHHVPVFILVISIFCCFFATSAGFGKWMCNTTLANFASTFAGSGSNGKGIARLNEP